MIEYLWPTPVLTLDAPFDADQLSELLVYSTGKAAYKRANPPVNKLPDITSIKLRGHYNLFDAEQEVGAPEVWHVFRRWVDTTYRAFLLDAHGVNNADDLDIVARCIVGHYTPGMRTPPHYHHTCDHVLCLYLDCGQDRPSRDTLTREKGDGELVLQDPRPMAGFPFWEKTKYIYTTPGLAVLHPSRVWHETNPFVGTGHRSLLAVTLRVASHNYGDLYVNL
jgi:hypothetical protein